MLPFFPHHRQRFEVLAEQIMGQAIQDNVYFCLGEGPAWEEQWRSLTAEGLGFDAGQREGLQAALQAWEGFTGSWVWIDGLEHQANPQGFLTKLAQIKEKRCPDRHFHWLVRLSGTMAAEFQGLQSFLDGQCYWFDFRLAIADVEEVLTAMWAGAWQEPAPLLPEDREQVRAGLGDWWATLDPLLAQMDLEPMSLLQGKLTLLRGLAQERQGDQGRQAARKSYQDSLDIWELLGDEEPCIWLTVRLAYLSLLEATGEPNRNHPLWQATQQYSAQAIAGLQSRQWHFFHPQTLTLLGEVLRGLEDWETLRQGAENSLIFFYQLSPYNPETELPQPDKPWPDLTLQHQIARAYAYLSEALVEQWKFDEAQEALKRAMETNSPMFPDAEAFTAGLKYLAGRIQLANDHPQEAIALLREALDRLTPTETPRLYLALLVELRECYLQRQDWPQVVAIDHQYQRQEYMFGYRAFSGVAPLPCSPHRRQPCHPLTPERLLGGPGPMEERLETPEFLAVPAFTPGHIGFVVGEPGRGKRSWVQMTLGDGLDSNRYLWVDFTPHWASQLMAQLTSLWGPVELSVGETEEKIDALAPWTDRLAGMAMGWRSEGSLPEPADESEAQAVAVLLGWLLPLVAEHHFTLVVCVDTTAIADWQTYLAHHYPDPLPPIQLLPFAPLTLADGETWLAQSMAGVRHPWSPSLQSQVLGDVALETHPDGPLTLFPLALQLLGSELESQRITQSTDYQRQKLGEWLTQALHRTLNFLTPPLPAIALRILQQLQDDHQTPVLKTASQLAIDVSPDPPESLPLLLDVLQRLRLIIPLPQGGLTYYRLSIPHLTLALPSPAANAPPPTLPAVPQNFSRPPSGPLGGSRSGSFGDRQAQIQTLMADLEKTANPDEQVALHKLQAAERQYQKILAGVRFERHSTVIAKQFDTSPLEGLLAAVETGKELQSWVTPETPWGDYPSLAPLLVLHNLLEQIHERNRFWHRSSVTSLQLSPPGEDGECLLLTATTSGTARIWSMEGALKATLQGHQAPITAVDWSGDGQYLVTASADHTVKLWNRYGQLVSTLQGHTDWVRSAHFNPRHEFIITASRDHTIRLWNFAGEELALCEGHSNWVRNAEFNCNGQILLSASRDGTARIWDLEGRELAQLAGHSSWVRNAQFSPDGQWIVTASADGTARIWDLTGRCLSLLKGHHNWVRNALWSPDGKMVITASSDGTARIWSLKGKCLALLQGHHQAIHDARFSPGGEWVLTCSVDGTARIWSRGGHLVSVLKGHQKDVYHGAFTPDGRSVFTISADHTARHWDLSPKKSIVLTGHGHWVRYAHFNPKGDRVLTVSRDKTARLWNLQGELVGILEGHQGWIREGVFSPDGQWIATASADKTVQLWNVSGKRLATLRGHQDAVLTVRFSRDGQYIVSAGKDGTARVWNTTGQELASLRRHHQAVYGAELSRDGQFIVTAGEDHTARIWDIVGRELGICQGHQEAVYDAQFSPDSQWVVTASADHTARVWDFLGQAVATLEGHQNMVYQAQFSPDSELIVTASADRTARIWNREGQALAVLYGHQGLVSSVQWSGDGQLIITTSNDGTARIWDRLGRELATLQGHHNWVRSGEFSRDGQWVVTGATDGTARLWPVESLAQLLYRGEAWLKDYLTHCPLVSPSMRPDREDH